MHKPTIFMFIVGALTAVGIILSFYGSQLIIGDLVNEERTLSTGDSFEIFTNLDPSISQVGVFVVQNMNFKEGAISTTVFDPNGNQISSPLIDKDSFEEQFDVFSAGEYKLLIENVGDEETVVVGVIGHMPDPSKLSIGITGFYLLVVGLVGMVGVGIYAIRNRRKIN